LTANSLPSLYFELEKFELEKFELEKFELEKFELPITTRLEYFTKSSFPKSMNLGVLRMDVAKDADFRKSVENIINNRLGRRYDLFIDFTFDNFYPIINS
jgi:hypothetical protein